MAPTKYPRDLEDTRISTCLESARKDMGFFCSLDRRYKVLKLPLLSRKKESTDCIFIKCRSFHNDLLH